MHNSSLKDTNDVFLRLPYHRLHYADHTGNQQAQKRYQQTQQHECLRRVQKMLDNVRRTTSSLSQSWSELTTKTNNLQSLVHYVTLLLNKLSDLPSRPDRRFSVTIWSRGDWGCLLMFFRCRLYTQCHELPFLVQCNLWAPIPYYFDYNSAVENGRNITPVMV